MCLGVESSLDHFGGTFDVDFRDVGVGWGVLLDACKVIVGDFRHGAP